MQRHRSQDRPVPSAEILGRDVLSADLLEICINVEGGYVPRLPAIVDILKQLLSGELLALTYPPCDAPIPNAQPPYLAALALEVETQFRPIHFDVTVLERGEAVALVL